MKFSIAASLLFSGLATASPVALNERQAAPVCPDGYKLVPYMPGPGPGIGFQCVPEDAKLKARDEVVVVEEEEEEELEVQQEAAACPDGYKLVPYMPGPGPGIGFKCVPV